MFAFSASYCEDVIEAKGEYDNLAALYPENQEPMKTVLDAIREAPQLSVLTKDEILEVLKKIVRYHGKAYDWQPQVRLQDMVSSVESGGYLLRSKIRAAIEYLDQLYLYGKIDKSSINELSKENFTESEDREMPVLNQLLQD
jgi:hypothetical protein